MLPNKGEGLQQHPVKNYLSQAVASNEVPAFDKSVDHTPKNLGEPFPEKYKFRAH